MSAVEAEVHVIIKPRETPTTYYASGYVLPQMDPNRRELLNTICCMSILFIPTLVGMSGATLSLSSRAVCSLDARMTMLLVGSAVAVAISGTLIVCASGHCHKDEEEPFKVYLRTNQYPSENCCTGISRQIGEKLLYSRFLKGAAAVILVATATGICVAIFANAPKC